MTGAATLASRREFPCWEFECGVVSRRQPEGLTHRTPPGSSGIFWASYAIFNSRERTEFVVVRVGGRVLPEGEDSSSKCAVLRDLQR
jgi:hypothetical protein